MFFWSLNNDEDILKTERLYKRYFQTLFFYANRILEDSYMAEDAVQQTFIRVIKHLEKIDENNESDTKKFLIIICRNISYNILEKEKKITYFPDFEELYEKDEKNLHISAEDESIFRADRNELIEKIQALSFPYNDILFLKYHFGYSYKEIKKLLNIPEQNLRKLAERGKKMIRSNLIKSEKEWHK